MTDRAFVAAEILDDTFGDKTWHEKMGEEISDAVDRSLSLYKEYGYTDEELPDFLIHTVKNVVWNWYTGGDTCYAVARRIIEAWNHAGLRVI